MDDYSYQKGGTYIQEIRGNKLIASTIHECHSKYAIRAKITYEEGFEFLPPQRFLALVRTKNQNVPLMWPQA